MEFFNIGTGEVVFLLILAILLVGPKRAVELVQQVSRFAARIQREWMAVQRDVMREVSTIKDETLKGVDPGLQKDIAGLQKDLAGLQKDANAGTQAVRKGMKGVSDALAVGQEGEHQARQSTPPPAEPTSDAL